MSASRSIRLRNRKRIVPMGKTLLRRQTRPLARRPPLRRRPALEELEPRCLLTGEFTDMGSLGLPKVEAAQWGDFDNDGRVDVLVAERQFDFQTAANVSVYRQN